MKKMSLFFSILSLSTVYCMHGMEKESWEQMILDAYEKDASGMKKKACPNPDTEVSTISFLQQVVGKRHELSEPNEKLFSALVNHLQLHKAKPLPDTLILTDNTSVTILPIMDGVDLFEFSVTKNIKQNS